MWIETIIVYGPDYLVALNEVIIEKLKTDKPASEQSAQNIKETEANVNAVRKAAFAGVNEKGPQNAAK